MELVDGLSGPTPLSNDPSRPSGKRRHRPSYLNLTLDSARFWRQSAVVNVVDAPMSAIICCNR